MKNGFYGNNKESKKNQKARLNSNNRQFENSSIMGINYGQSSNQLYEDIIAEENKNIGNSQLLCQKELNMQLYLRRQKNFSDTFKSCYNSMKDYIKNPSSKGNFLWTLESFCSMVNLWKKDYPDYEPQLSKEFNKDKIKLELKGLAKKAENNKNYDPMLFDKFYHLVNGEKQNFEDESTVLSYFPEVKPTESIVISNATNLIEINRKVERDNEKEEFNGYANFDVDPKIKHLRNNNK